MTDSGESETINHAKTIQASVRGIAEENRMRSVRRAAEGGRELGRRERRRRQERFADAQDNVADVSIQIDD